MINLCDVGNRLFAEYKQQETLMYERMSTATEPFDLSDEFYQAVENYINHVDDCSICKGKRTAYMRCVMFGKAVDEFVDPIKQSLDKLYKEFERIIQK